MFRFHAELAGEERVVPELGVRVEGEVVGGEAHVVIEEDAQAFPCLAPDHARVAVPVEPVVGEDELRADLDRALEELARGRDAAGDLLHLGRPFHLEAHRSVVGIRVEVEELGREAKDLVPRGHSRYPSARSGCSAAW